MIRFAAVGLDHAHAFGQIEGLLNQGCELVGFSSDDPTAAVAQAARRRWPDVTWVDDSTSLLRDLSIDLIVIAAVPDRRSAIAVEALTNGKDVVADKPGCVTLEQLDEIEKAVSQSGRFWSVTFSERFEVRCAIKAGQLVREGRIGRVVQTLGLGPHRPVLPRPPAQRARDAADRRRPRRRHQLQARVPGDQVGQRLVVGRRQRRRPGEQDVRRRATDRHDRQPGRGRRGRRCRRRSTRSAPGSPRMVGSGRRVPDARRWKMPSLASSRPASTSARSAATAAPPILA